MHADPATVARRLAAPGREVLLEACPRFAKLVRSVNSIASIIQFIKDEDEEFNNIAELPGREDLRQTSPWLFERKRHHA